MNIFENFTELPRKENFSELKLMFTELIDKKYVYKNFFDESIFYEKINITKLKVQEVEEIDNFIKERLRAYPNLYPHIVKFRTKNYERDNININKKLEKEAKKLLGTQETLKVVDTLILKKLTKSGIKKMSSEFSNGKAKDLFEKLGAFISEETTVDDIIKELEEQIENSFADYLFPDEIKVLARCMGCEVYFRTKKPAIYCDSFSKVENKYNELQQNKKYALKEKANKMLSDGRSEEDIEKIVEEISKDLIK